MKFTALITHGRSGGTALQNALNSVPGVIIRGENHAALYWLGKAFRSLQYARKFGAGNGEDPGGPWFGAGGINLDGFLAAQRALVIEQILRPGSSTELLGFKEIRYEPAWIPSFEELLDHLIFLDELFPGICFVINRRNPAVSSKSSWWAGFPDAFQRLECVYEWFGSLPDYLEARLGRNAALLVEYEEWSTDSGKLEPVWDFLGLGWDAGRVREVLGHRLAH
jgi:hypothetical protein